MGTIKEIRIRLDLENEAHRYVADELMKRKNGIATSVPQIALHSLYEYFQKEERTEEWKEALSEVLTPLLEAQTRQILGGDVPPQKAQDEPVTIQESPERSPSQEEKRQRELWEEDREVYGDISKGQEEPVLEDSRTDGADSETLVQDLPTEEPEKPAFQPGVLDFMKQFNP